MKLAIVFLTLPLTLTCKTRGNNAGLRSKVELTGENARATRDECLLKSKVHELDEEPIRKQYLDDPRLIGSLLPAE